MPNCRDVELMVQDYLDGYLLPGQREALERHLVQCPACRTLVDKFRHLNEDLVDVPWVDTPGDLGSRILDAIPSGAAFRPGPASWFRHVGTSLAALLIVTAGFLLGSRYAMNAGEGIQEVEVVFHAPAAQSVAVVGDFNSWDGERHRMEKDEGVWRIRLRLRPGVYEYGFLIDDRNWSKDPGAENFLADGFGGENSILFVGG